MTVHKAKNRPHQKLTRDRRMEAPESLRRLLSVPELATKRKRMGKVISVTDHRISFYE
jgi:hypothetical protein